MTAPIQTLNLDSHYSVFRSIMAPRLQANVGNGVMQARRKYRRPTYIFRVHDSMAIQSQAEYLYSFAQYHNSDTPFWWSGGPWATPSTPLLIDFGDGSRTQFFLPNRNITVSTTAVYDNGSPSTISSVDLTSGLVTLSSAPADGHTITATFTCKYKVVFELEQDTLLNEEQFYAHLFRYEGIVLREVLF